jgi:hypothetical protein
MMISGAAAFSGNVIPEDWIWIALTGLVIWLPSFVIHWRLRVRRDLELRRLEASQPQPAPAVVTRDQPIETASAAAPVLYLRSFDDDQRSSRTKGNLTEEELLVHLLGHFGPVMAVGRPGEAIRPVGAQRVYLRDADWQQVVEDLIRRARLVVMRTGRTSGLQWELSRALEALQPKQLIMVVDDKKELRGFLQLIRRVHPEAPDSLRIGWRSAGTLRGFVIFGKGWQPRMLRMRWSAWLLYQHENDTYTGVKLARTLRPVFDRMGVKWPRPAINLLLILWLAFWAVFFIAVALGLVD